MFLRQVWIQAQSMRRFGGEIARHARFHVWVSPDAAIRDLHREHPWARPLGIEFHWVDPQLFGEHWYYGTALARGDGDFQSDLVLFLDADVLVAGSLDNWLEGLLRESAVAGLPAHVDALDKDVDAWERLFAHSALPAPRRDTLPSGEGILPDLFPRPMPAYWNLGVIAGPNAWMRRLGQDLVAELPRINTFISTYFRCQIAVALRLARHQIPYRQVDIRYNFPNDPLFEAAYPEQVPDIRLLHFLRCTEQVDKSQDFSDSERYQALLGRKGLSGSNALLQDRLRALGPYPGDPWPRRLRQRWLKGWQ
jgi:hypothetical protein